MGKVTNYCFISGGSCEVQNELNVLRTERIFEIFEEEEDHDLLDDVKVDPTLLEALKGLEDEDQKLGEEDLCILGPFDDQGKGLFLPDPGNDAFDIDEIPLEKIGGIPHCTPGNEWDFGCVTPPSSLPDQSTMYIVNFGPILLTQTSTLPILQAASDGKFTLSRFWNFVHRVNKSDAARRAKHFGGTRGVWGIDYGILNNAREQFVWPFHRGGGETSKQFKKLIVTGDVEMTKEKLIWEGGYWGWLRPDRFPLDPDPASRPPSFVPPMTDSQTATSTSHQTDGPTLLSLPIEVLLMTSTHLPLKSLVAFAMVSKIVRSIIMQPKNRDYLARVEITEKRRWFLPIGSQAAGTHPESPKPNNVGSSTGENAGLTTTVRIEDYEVKSPWRETPKQELMVSKDGMGWNYLQRCMKSPNLKNRERIWGIVEQMVKKSEEMGL